MNLYHRTYVAERIITDGFFASEKGFVALDVHPGIWVTDEPVDERDGALGNVVLVISGVPEAAVAGFEWSHTGPRPFREFVVPAQILNRFPIVGIYPDTWTWLSGNFEYVGSLIDMRPILAEVERSHESGSPFQPVDGGLDAPLPKGARASGSG